MNAMKIDQGNAGRQVLSRVSLPSLNSGRVVSCEAVAPFSFARQLFRSFLLTETLVAGARLVRARRTPFPYQPGPSYNFLLQSVGRIEKVGGRKKREPK